MAAIRARIKMVGPRQLYRLGSDGAVGMRVYTHNERGKKRSSRHSLIGIAPPVLALPVYLYVYDAKMADDEPRRETTSTRLID